MDNGSSHLQVKRPMIADDGCGEGCLVQRILLAEQLPTGQMANGLVCKGSYHTVNSLART